MRIALFGAGRIGPLHTRTLLDTGVVEGSTVMDIVPERAAAAARELGGTAVTTVAGALQAADAVVITASTDDHPDLIREAIAKGLPTFCDKPLAASLDDSIAVRADIEALRIAEALTVSARERRLVRLTEIPS